jgi:hypothetical protein
VIGVAVVAGYANRDRIRLKIASVYASVPPKAAQTPPPSARQAVAFRGDAPWALSALPECFSQISKSTSPTLDYVLAHLPKGATMVRPPHDLSYADCKVRIAGDAIYVDRGADRLRVPPPARLYVNDGQVALLRGGVGGYELRVYTTMAAPSGK